MSFGHPRRVVEAADRPARLGTRRVAARRGDDAHGRGVAPREGVSRERARGRCDERGSEEYNLGLGDRRATATKNFLVNLGISADRINTISYGKSRPQCSESNEDCWQKNRRAHFHYGR